MNSKDDPTMASDVWYNVGYIYSILGDLDMAKEAYLLSLSFIPDNIESLNNLAVISSRKGHIDIAINYAEKSYRELDNF